MFRETFESDSPAIRNMPFADGVIPAGRDGSFLGAGGFRCLRQSQFRAVYEEGGLSFSEFLTN